MEESKENPDEMNSNHQEADNGPISQIADSVVPVAVEPDKDSSQNLFPDSPVYEPEDEIELVTTSTVDETNIGSSELQETQSTQPKRKLSEELSNNNAKIQKLELSDDEFAVSTQSLDNEVSEITTNAKEPVSDITSVAIRKIEDVEHPSTSRARTPFRSSPRRLKRSNSADISKATTPKTPRSRPASVDVTKTRKTPRKLSNPTPKDDPKEAVVSSSSNSRSNVESKTPPAVPEKILEEEASELDDSQGFHLVLSPSPEDDVNKDQSVSNSDPVLVKNRDEDINPGKVSASRSEGYTFSDQGNFSQPKSKEYVGRGTDQESTDSVCSISFSPEHAPSVASKLISKLSNGNSSTPTEMPDGKLGGAEDSDCTPDMIKLNNNKGKRGKNESFRSSNNATPSTISPLANGHSLPITTPHVPVFDVHISHNEDNEFLSLYVVRTDNDIGMDMCREYQRISKRFTIDPYLGDVSVSTSPSSVTSGGMINLPNRTSFASTVSSTSTSSNRTSDGAFVVPQPPRKSIANPTTTVKGYEALMKKLQDIFSHIRDSSVDESNDEKVSVGIQTSVSSDSTISNGNASPEEVNKCDKVTPKSSLKKSRVRGRRHIAGKTKRALLPTQPEEPEYLHIMNSPEMVPTNGDNGKDSPVKSPKEEKPLSSLVATPKSVSKLKAKKRPTSPRPATPVEKAVVKTEYPGFPTDTVVLAKWVDKSYYSGKVLEITEPNKYLIKFDDGQVKVLLDDFIIFGDMKTLPLEGQSVYAMVDEEQNYEPGLVLGVEENDSGTVTYKCTTDGDTIVMVTASELYLTEDQARSLKESSRPRSPSTPSTPRRRHNRELDLDNIIQGPRSARSRDKGSSRGKKRVVSPKSPKASTSEKASAETSGEHDTVHMRNITEGPGKGYLKGVKSNKSTPAPARKRLASESSEISESSNSAPPARLDDVAGVEPEVQRTPRKIDGVKAGPLQLKGAAKQNIGKKNSKLTKFENDEDTVSMLGPIPGPESKLFAGLHFLLTCTEPPKRSKTDKTQSHETRHYSSEEDGETTSVAGTDTEDLEFCDRPFNKERLKEQIEAGGGIVYSHFDDVPKSKYPSTRLVAPRPCLTAKYISCVAADVRALSHGWVILSCAAGARKDQDSFALPAGWSILKQRFINWLPPHGKRSTFFKDKLILVCSEQEQFVSFWQRILTLAGASSRAVLGADLQMAGALALVTEWDACPHEVQNRANQDNVPLVSTTWLTQCLIEARIISPTSHDKFSFMYTEPE